MGSSMLGQLRLLLAACFYYLGFVGLALWWKQYLRRSLTILNYHHAAGGHLREQMLYLRQHYRILHLEEALLRCF